MNITVVLLHAGCTAFLCQWGRKNEKKDPNTKISIGLEVVIKQIKVALRAVDI